MEQTILVAARLRRLNDDEFDALRLMVVDGVEPPHEQTLGVICDALADCVDVVRAEGRTVQEVAHA